MGSLEEREKRVERGHGANSNLVIKIAVAEGREI